MDHENMNENNQRAYSWSVVDRMLRPGRMAPAPGSCSRVWSGLRTLFRESFCNWLYAR